MNVLILIALAILSGILYRLGGWGDEGRAAMPWAPKWLFNTKARDVGCAVVTMGGMMYFLDNPWWAHLISFGLLFAALTTYWDFLFGYDNHWFHGFACGLAYFPYAIGNVGWVGFGVRCIACAILMGAVSILSDNDVVEEVGRGAVLPLTLPLLFII